MSESKLVKTPADKARLELWSQMTPETQKVADSCDQLFAKSQGVSIVYLYQVGVYVSRVLKTNEKNESTYGTKAIKQIADYTRKTETFLYNLKNIALAFEESFVREWSPKMNSEGVCLSLNHWGILAQLKNATEREGWLKKAIANNWSSKELADHINASGTAKRAAPRSGGRTPNRPTSPLLGLHKVEMMANTFVNYTEKNAKFIFDAIDTIDPGSVTEALGKKLEETDEALAGLEKDVVEARDHIKKNKARVEKVLAQKEKAATEDEGEAPKAKAKPAQAGKKPSGNGKPAQAGKKKPAAATA